MIPAFPKIFAVGSKQTTQLFDDRVEITEKLDGSQIAFGKLDGELIIRSKNCRIYPENVDKMFALAVVQILSFERFLPEDTFFYGEYLRANKHNCLVYDTVPKKNIALFGIKRGHTFLDHDAIVEYADLLGVGYVPLLYQGNINTYDELDEFLKQSSYLGGVREGVVVKNYKKDLLIGGQVIPILMGKYVSEQFKEVSKSSWSKENTGKGKWETYKSQFRTAARWYKAIQHLRDSNELTQSPKDIGKLSKEVFTDIDREEQENIKEWLWNNYKQEIFRESTKGLAEWYKEELARGLFNEQICR